ncbi:hypothetical protein Salat_2680200 [Sesamum alatum]|uniref:Uncharacterized protein n=1 Tax=Sesamum alatum TaxID=300844 RepID=A0AAE2CB57_9LAMI|nr:hypothetical protein Salat_2680200 [Sesamum alatum]
MLFLGLWWAYQVLGKGIGVEYIDCLSGSVFVRSTRILTRLTGFGPSHPLIGLVWAGIRVFGRGLRVRLQGLVAQGPSAGCVVSGGQKIFLKFVGGSFSFSFSSIWSDPIGDSAGDGEMVSRGFVGEWLSKLFLELCMNEFGTLGFSALSHGPNRSLWFCVAVVFLVFWAGVEFMSNNTTDMTQFTETLIPDLKHAFSISLAVEYDLVLEWFRHVNFNSDSEFFPLSMTVCSKICFDEFSDQISNFLLTL